MRRENKSPADMHTDKCKQARAFAGIPLACCPALLIVCVLAERTTWSFSYCSRLLQSQLEMLLPPHSFSVFLTSSQPLANVFSQVFLRFTILLSICCKASSKPLVKEVSSSSAKTVVVWPLLALRPPSS